MATDNFLVVAPGELKFRFELRKNVPCTLTLQNPTGERVAFKVKTTSPKKYCVRPSSGIVEPGSSKEVQVIMQAQREYPPSLADCKDKFLVQCVKLAPGSGDAKEVTPDMFDASKGKDIRQTKLRVVLVGPPKPPSPVPEGVEEPTSPATLGYKDAPSGVREQLGAAAGDKAEIRKRLQMLEGSAAGGRGGARQAPKARGGFGVFALLLVAVLAFLAGHFGSVALPFLTEKLQELTGGGGGASGKASSYSEL